MVIDVVVVIVVLVVVADVVVGGGKFLLLPIPLLFSCGVAVVFTDIVVAVGNVVA